MREITQQGITALKSGDRAAAFRLLAAAVRQDPNDAQAWLWLSGAVDSDAARIDCMRQVLRIEPGSAAAAQGLAQLLKKQGGGDLTPQPPSRSGKGGQEEAAADNLPAAAEVLPAAAENLPAAEVLPAADNLPAAEFTTETAPPVESAPAQIETLTHPPTDDADSSSPFPKREDSSPHDDYSRQAQQNAANFGRGVSSTSAAAIYPGIDSMRAVYEQPEQAGEAEAPTSVHALAENFPETAEAPLPAENRPRSAAAPSPSTPLYRARTRPEAAYATSRGAYATSGGAYADQKVVFKTRPSHVPALISFWVFFFGAYYIGAQFSDPDYVLGASIGFGLGIALELVIIYMIITNFRTRYTLTNQELRMHIIISEGMLPHGRSIVIPLRDIYSAECRQSFLQQIMGIGDLYFDAAVDGQLTPMHLRGIPNCSQRAQQLLYLVRELHEPSTILTREVS